MTAPVFRYVAHFTPEAWVNDYAVEVDPEGPQEWDCTEFAAQHEDYLARLAERESGVESLDDGIGIVDNDDLFAHDPAAPQWVRDHHGPFTIRIRCEDARQEASR